MFGEAFDLTFAQVVVLFPKPYQTRGGKVSSAIATSPVFLLLRGPHLFTIREGFLGQSFRMNPL